MAKEKPRGAKSKDQLAEPHFLTKEGGEGGKLLRRHATAVICHLHYPDLLDELVKALEPLEGDFDLYISIPRDVIDLVPEIFARFPTASILPMENIGRDINPFLVILKAILPLGYERLLKIHTKRSPHRADGDAWRQDMYARLLGNRGNVLKIQQRLAADRGVGIIAPKGHVVSYRAYCGASRDRVLAIANAAGLAYAEEHDFSFVAGTMFWAKPQALAALTLIPVEQLQYEDEMIVLDGALVHALERFIGLAVHKAGLEILETDGHGKISKPDLTQTYPYTEPSKQLKLADIHKVIFFSAYGERFAIEHLRVTGPYRQAGIEVVAGIVNGEARYDLIPGTDAVIIQREFPRNLPVYEQIHQAANDHYIPIIYDLDDLLFDLPESHPERQAMDYTGALMPMLSTLMQADLVTVSTGKLKETLLDFNENIQILPNYLDDNLWQVNPPRKADPDSDRVTIGYMGSVSHTPDLEMITPVLVELLAKYGDSLQLHIWGTEMPENMRNNPQVIHTPSQTNNYHEFAAYFQQQEADIFIAPLADNLFNRCKSGLKFLEYSALGVPGVYSNLDGYSEMITHGQDGFLADSPGEWKEHLVRLIEDPALRADMAAKAQQTVRERWLLSKNVTAWQDIFRVEEPGFNYRRPVKMTSSGLIHAISRQIFWMQAAREALARDLNQRNQELVGALETSEAVRANENSILEAERERLENEHSALEAVRETLAKLEASYQAKQNEYLTLLEKSRSQVEQIDTLKTQASTAQANMHLLEARYLTKQKEYQALQERSRSQAGQIDTIKTQLDAAQVNIHLLEGKQAQMSATINGLSGQLQEKETDGQRLAGLLDEKVQQNLGLTEELNARVSELDGIKSSKSWKAALLLRKVRGKVAPVDGYITKAVKKTYNLVFSHVRKLRNQITIGQDLKRIKTSQQFDKDWYLIINPDIQRAKADPVAHYLLYGAFEGRDPGPKFSSSQYLADYDDVRNSGMNPLLHYLKFGEKEGRRIEQAKNIEPEMMSYDGILSGNQLFQKIFPNLSQKRLVLSISHDNYLKIVGGVQIKISDEHKTSTKAGVGYLHLYPYVNRPNLTNNNEQLYIGVNVNGVEIGITDRPGIKKALKKLGHARISEIRIHHMMGFDLMLVSELIKRTHKASVQFWLHDFFSICPGYFLLRNDMEFCGVPKLKSNECSICKYGKQRQLQYPEFSKLFNKINMEVIAPSTFALDLWKSSFPLSSCTTRVVPHLHLNWGESTPSVRTSQKIRVAFVGFPVNHKGWFAWKRLLEQVGSDSRYTFIHFSSVNGNIDNCENIPISVSPENRAAMAEALRDNEIDTAFLWSICPETFSYTLFESLAAGCFIITNKDSGNIQKYIIENPHRGVVLENEESLIGLFISEGIGRLVSEYQKDGIPKAELVFPVESE